MLKKIINLDDVSKEFEYYEFEKKSKDCSYLIIKKSKDYIEIEVDKFSTIPFYYYLFKNKLYGSTSLIDLIKKKNNFNISLNIEAALFFLKTNTFLNHHTLVNEIKRIPYGSKLKFNQLNKKIKIERYWNFSDKINDKSYEINLKNTYEVFEQSMDYLTSFKSNLALNISGGYDTRQLLGYFIKNKKKFTGYTYGVTENPDQIIALKLSKKNNFPLIFDEWKGVNFYKDKFDEYFEITDGMLAFHHFHPFKILKKQFNRSEDIVFYGHFLDFYLQGWNYQKILENNSFKNVKNFLINDFSKSAHFSTISDHDFQKLVQNKYKFLFNDLINKELEKFKYLPPEKIYDAMYFIHHGSRRLMPQVQASNRYVKYCVPGLHFPFFENCWSIPGKIKKNNSIKENLIKTYYKEVCNVEILFNNYKLDYIGNIPFLDIFYKSLRILRSKKVGILKPYYDFWGVEIYKLINRDLKNWIDNEIETSPLYDYKILNNDKYKNFLKRENFNFSNYGTFLILGKFIKSFF